MHHKKTIKHIGFIFSNEANFVKFFQYSEQAICNSSKNKGTYANDAKNVNKDSPID